MQVSTHLFVNFCCECPPPPYPPTATIQKHYLLLLSIIYLKMLICGWDGGTTLKGLNHPEGGRKCVSFFHFSFSPTLSEININVSKMSKS